MGEDIRSPLQQFREIEAQLQLLMSGLPLEIAGVPTRKPAELIHRTLEQTHKLLKDYESEEDLQLQAYLLPTAVKQLELLRKQVLDASQYNVFSAIDVAQLSAELDQLIERLG